MESASLCTLARRYDNPSLISECAPPLRTGPGGGGTAGEGLGESQFRRLEKKLSTLCTNY
jgi:hypothetical protein